MGRKLCEEWLNNDFTEIFIDAENVRKGRFTLEILHRNKVPP